MTTVQTQIDRPRRPAMRPPTPRPPQPPDSDRRSRTRDEWVAWGLPELDERYYSDWVYKDLPPMGEFCEAELRHGLEQIRISQCVIQTKLDTLALPQEQRDKLVNVLSKMLAPQCALIQVALDRLVGVADRDRFDLKLCQSIDAVLSVFDDAAPIAEAAMAIDRLEQLFKSTGYAPGQDRLDRLRSSLSPELHIANATP